MLELAKRAARCISNSKSTVALTGAGISVESDIPPFRGKHGLWSRYDPSEYAHIDNFQKNPPKVWEMLKELIEICYNAVPNMAHISLARLEEMGMLDGIITQNIDGLHQRAGSKEVIEFHGGNTTLSCMECKKSYPTEEVSIKEIPPKCGCGGVLRPDFVFFGEQIPPSCLVRSLELSQKCELMLIIGTTGIVNPSAQMPYVAKSTGATLIEINPETSALTGMVDIHIRGKAAETMGLIMDNLLDEGVDL